MFNSSKWADLYGEDGQPERVICPTCEHPCRNEQCVNVHCKDTDIAYVCNDCQTGWLEDDFPGGLCPECGGDILNIAQFNEGGITQRAVDWRGTCLHSNIDPDACVCLDCGESRPVPANR